MNWHAVVRLENLFIKKRDLLDESRNHAGCLVTE